VTGLLEVIACGGIFDQRAVYVIFPALRDAEKPKHEGELIVNLPFECVISGLLDQGQGVS
jgi:hypothetical protein